MCSAFRVLSLTTITIGVACSAPAATEPECATTADCTAGLSCLEARCVPRPIDGGLDVGCASGGCECNVSSECTSPAPCIEPVCVLGACRRFAYDSRCASGEYCDAALGCTPIPDAGSIDAPPPDAPRPDAGIPRRDAGLLPVGDRCIFDRECAGVAGRPPRCINALGELAPGLPAPPGGYCSATCTPFVPADCGADALCVETDALASLAWCLRTCASPADCRAGHTCAVSPFGGGGSARVCLPPL